MNPSTCLAQLARGPIGFESPEADQIGIQTFHRLRVYYPTAHYTSQHPDFRQVRSALILYKQKGLADQVKVRRASAVNHFRSMEWRTPVPQDLSHDATIQRLLTPRGGNV